MTTTPADFPHRLTALPDQAGIDPDSITFTAGCLGHAERVGFTLDQMRAALADPRWVNRVRHPLPDPVSSRPDLRCLNPTRATSRLRYCGHGVAVIVDGDHAIAVIDDDLSKQPPTMFVREEHCVA